MYLQPPAFDIHSSSHAAHGTFPQLAEYAAKGELFLVGDAAATDEEMSPPEFSIAFLGFNMVFFWALGFH